VIHVDGLYVTTPESSFYAQTWSVNNLTAHYSYSSGIVIAPGSKISGASLYFESPPPGSCYSSTDNNDQIDLYGYLTAS
jgi:hypothetical protein